MGDLACVIHRPNKGKPCYHGTVTVFGRLKKGRRPLTVKVHEKKSSPKTYECTSFTWLRGGFFVARINGVKADKTQHKLEISDGTDVFTLDDLDVRDPVYDSQSQKNDGNAASGTSRPVTHVVMFPPNSANICPDYFYAYGSFTHPIASATMNSVEAIYIDNDFSLNEWFALFPSLEPGSYTLTTVDSNSDPQQRFNLSAQPENCE